jgi:ABC-2 type transport system ATP-binding protein
VTKEYASKAVVNDISFSIATGDIVGFIGANGAGKTTTMRMLTTFIPPTKGSIRIQGLDIIEDAEKIRQIVGYLPENPPLYPELTIGRYLRFIAELRQVEKPAVTIAKVLEQVGLKGWENTVIQSLSKGYKQRVGLAQAIVHQPKLLILDEPSTGLDPSQMVGIRNFIDELATDRTVVLSTHILPEVEKLCNRSLIIHKGKILADGTVEELQRRYQGYVLRVELVAEQAPLQVLSTLPNIAKVVLHQQRGQCYIVDICLSPEVDGAIEHDAVVAKVMQLSMEKPWKIRAMHKVDHSLEELYLSLVGAEK